MSKKSKSSFQPFERSFIPLLSSPCHQQRKVVNALLRECLSQESSEINIEPGLDGECNIFFRVDGILHKALVVSGSQGASLREAVQNAAFDLQPGQFDVVEGTLTVSVDGKEKSFNFYNIPQTPFNSILIRVAANSIQCSTVKNEEQKEQVVLSNLGRNIDKKIFIWQMGKVGSSTIYRSLLPYSKPCVWDVPSIKNNSRWPIHNNVIQTHSINLLYDFLHYSEEEFVVVSLVRDLLSRNISAVFQSMNDEEERCNQQFVASIDDFQKMSFDQQEEKISQQLLRLNTGTTVTAWYDNLLKSHVYYPEIDKYFVDIYSKPFDQQKGYQTYESKTKRIKMIIIRLENLNDQVNTLGEFLGIDDLQIVSRNVATDKWYNSIYQRFKQRYKPTPEELESIYTSRFMMYFYSPIQIRLLIEGWRNHG